MKTSIEYYISKIIKKLHFRAIKNCKIHFTSKVCSGSHLVNVTMDKFSDIGYDCSILDTKIGSFCSLGSNITIGGPSHTTNWVSTSPVFNENKDHIKRKFSLHKFNYSSFTEIGNDIWIGDNAMIKAGVKVGDGAIIGMNSVVTKNIPPYEIWAGNPAKMIKKRFPDDTIIALLKIKWWEKDENTLIEMSTLFNNIDEFLLKYSK